MARLAQQVTVQVTDTIDLRRPRIGNRDGNRGMWRRPNNETFLQNRMFDVPGFHLTLNLACD
jgi:hypothetical protein